MDAAFGARYRRLFEEHWWWRSREEVVLEVLRQWDSEAPRERRRILDAGCGDALFLPALEAFGEPWGLETESALLDPAGPYFERVHQGPLDATYAPPAPFDWVLLLDVIEHIEDEGVALERAAELMRPGGRLLVTVPALESLWTKHDDLNHHYRRYRRRTLRGVLEGAGFEIQRLEYFFHWTVVGKLWVRLQESIVDRSPQPAEVPGAAVNRALLALSRFERRALRRLRLPVGSSLLACARKS